MRNQIGYVTSKESMRGLFRTGTLCATLLLLFDWGVAQSGGFKCGNQIRPQSKMNLGDVTKKALQLPRPKYPQVAKTAGAYGNVKVQVVIDMNSGAVVWAQTITGHPLLQAAASDVACKARFAPIFDADGFVSGFLTYRFARRR